MLIDKIKNDCPLPAGDLLIQSIADDQSQNWVTAHLIASCKLPDPAPGNFSTTL